MSVYTEYKRLKRAESHYLNMAKVGAPNLRQAYLAGAKASQEEMEKIRAQVMAFLDREDV